MADTYEIIDQRQTTAFTAGNRLADVMEITYRSKATGQVGRIDVPKSQYTAARVDELVGAEVAEMDAVARL